MIHALTLAWICRKGKPTSPSFSSHSTAPFSSSSCGSAKHTRRPVIRSRSQQPEVGGDDRPGLSIPFPRTVLTKVMGGPVLMRKEDKHVMVYADSELDRTKTPEEIAKW